MASLYTFSEYSAAWPDQFQREADRLRALLGDEVVAVHHIGSTSVPGLAAKPIIDVIPLVRSLATLDQRAAELEHAGYRAWGEYGLPGRRLFTKDHAGYRTHNVHMYQAGDPDVVRHLAFPAFLRKHPEWRDRYAELKRTVYAMHPDDIAAYGQAKHDFVQQVQTMAVAWYGDGSGRDDG